MVGDLIPPPTPDYESTFNFWTYANGNNNPLKTSKVTKINLSE